MQTQEKPSNGDNIMDSEKVIKRDNEYVLHTYGQPCCPRKRATA